MVRADLLRRIRDEHFRSFRIHVSDGTVLTVDEPLMVIVGESSAVIPTRLVKTADGYRIAKNWRTIDLDQITRVSDIRRSDGKRR